GRAQRDTIWHELDRVFRPGQHILEINCGTGVDAIYLASRGVDVLACDSAPRMIEVARKRLLKAQPRSKPPSGRRWGRVDFRALARAFAPAFRLKRWKGVGVVVPPSYLEPLAERFSKSFDRVASLDRWIGRCPVVRGAADHVLLTFERAMT